MVVTRASWISAAIAAAGCLTFLFAPSPGHVRAQSVTPHRSFSRLVTSNGLAAASFDRTSRRIDMFLEHVYRFAAPRNPGEASLCFSADESRDLAHDAYFGVLDAGAGTGTWAPDAPLDDAGYVPGTNILFADQHVGPGRSLALRTWAFMPMSVDVPALVMALRVTNEGTTSARLSAVSLFNFRLGTAGGAREPNANGEEVSFDASRRTFYEYGPGQGTMAYVALSAAAAQTVSTGSNGAYERLRRGQGLDGTRATSGPTDDVAPAFQSTEVTLAAGASTWFAVAVVWALDEDAAPKVDAVRAWAGDRSPEELVGGEQRAWDAWHTTPPSALTTDAERALWKQSAAMIRMAQSRESGAGHGQILASLPPGLGNVDAQWNIAWVRDMAYATAALARSGHLDEARDALLFQLRAPRGRHTDQVGRPYRISVTRYFGNGDEESDCNADGPNIEFDGFGLFLWSLGEYARAGGDLAPIREAWAVVRDEVADVLVSLLDADGLVRADSSIWEVHQNGKQRRFTYTSLAAARGLCDASAVATQLGMADDAARWAEAGARVRDAVARKSTDRRGALAQSAEDLLMGHGYVDAAAVEAIDWGIVRPDGRVAHATLDAILGNLRTASGGGFMRNDDGGWYDSQEWVFVDLRLLPAFSAAARTAEHDRMFTWSTAMAARNDLQFAELHDARTADYAGSIPMVGFGAGAFMLAMSDTPVLPAACGAYAMEPPAPAAPDAGTDVPPPPGGSSGCTVVAAPRPGSRAGWIALAMAAFAIVLLGSRRRRAGRRSSAVLHAAASVCASAAFLAGGCDSGDERAPEPFDGKCEVALTYQATGTEARVFAAGDWNAFSDSADELLDDGTGRYRLGLRLTPGVHPYKLVVRGDGREPWRLDPANTYRAYSGGIENSGLRVADCSAPALRVVSTSVSPRDGAFSFEARVAYDARRGARLDHVEAEVTAAGVSRDLEGSELSRDGDELVVRIDGLPHGKHTVKLVAHARDGRDSEPLLLPFWAEAAPFTWHDAVIYMVMTDRFRNGEPSNDHPDSDASPGANWAGGDLQGVTAAMRDGYFESLGVNTLWLTPYNENAQGTYSDADEFHRVAAYHGYWPTDPRDVDARIGGPDALRELTREAHARGIRVLMDLVVNHVHENHPYVHDHPRWFNQGCVCGSPGCDWTARRLDCLFRPYLPDVDWTNGEASEAFIDDAVTWMERYDLDGFRVDAVKHVVDGAIFNLAERVRERFETAGTKVFLMGETAMGWDGGAGPREGGNIENYGTISRYIGKNGLDGQFDFVLYYAGAMQLLGENPGRGMAHVDYWSRASLAEYPSGAIMTPYIGSHDSSRFITLSATPDRANNKWDNLPTAPSSQDSYDRMYTAFGWLFALPGAPLLYYGDEYGEFGGADPDNRHVMRFGDQLAARERAQLTRVSALLQARKALPGLRSTAYRTLLATDDLWVVLRGEGTDAVLVVLSRSATPTNLSLAIPRDAFEEGHMLVDALDPGTHVMVTRAGIDVAMPPRSVRYFH